MEMNHPEQRHEPHIEDAVENNAHTENLYEAPGSNTDVPPQGTPDSTLTTISWGSYILHFIVALAAIVPSLQASILLLLLAFVIDLVKKKDAENTWLESHFTYRIDSVIWAGVLYLLTAPLWLLLVIPGGIAWGGISLWFLYRIIKGMLALSNQTEVV